MTKEKTKTKTQTPKEEHEAEVKQWIADEIKSMLPQITDKVHMRTALAMECDYKVIKKYLAGEVEDVTFGKLLVEVLDHALTSVKNERIVEQAGGLGERILYRAVEILKESHDNTKSIIKRLMKLEENQHVNFNVLANSIGSIKDEIVLSKKPKKSGKAKK
jgi:hypothetical protein